MTITFTWQDLALIAICFCWCIYLANKSGYKYGLGEERYRKHQGDLEKSGDFFMWKGMRIQSPKPPPKSPLPPPTEQPTA